MLVTFADSHSALSVLDVDGMKVSRARPPWSGGSSTPLVFSSFHWIVLSPLLTCTFRGATRGQELGLFILVSSLRRLMSSPGRLKGSGGRASLRGWLPLSSGVCLRARLLGQLLPSSSSLCVL